ncbi:MAG: hypothetical protein JJT96_11675 [Opitutales bacterium]|nr:hypothetical protein [Opitutales bacterium]
MIDIGLPDLLKSLPPSRWPDVVGEWDSDRVDFIVVLEKEARRRFVPVGPGCEVKTLARALGGRADGWKCLAYCASRKTRECMLETRLKAQFEEKNRQAVGDDEVIVPRLRLQQLEQIEREMVEFENQILARMAELAEREALLEEREEANILHQFKEESG